MQKFNDVINFLSFPREKMDLHQPGRKIDTVSKITSYKKSRRSVNSAKKVIFLSFLVHPQLLSTGEGLTVYLTGANISIISFWARGGGQFHIGSDVDVWGYDFLP